MLGVSRYGDIGEGGDLSGVEAVTDIGGGVSQEGNFGDAKFGLGGGTFQVVFRKWPKRAHSTWKVWLGSKTLMLSG